MSLLLDALNRASQDKAAAAAAASAEAAAPKPGEMTFDLPAPGPEAPPALGPRSRATAPIAAPGNDWPTLGLELTPPTAVQAPLPPPQPPSLAEHRAEPPMAVPLPKFEPPAAPFSNRAPPRDAPRVAQSIVRAKAAGPKAARPTRLIALLSIAVLLAAGLGSILLGLWGDPMTWIQNAAVTPPAVPTTAIAPALAPTAAIETAPAPVPARQPPPTVADLTPPRTPARPSNALRSPTRPSTAVDSTGADRDSAECAAGLSPPECEAAKRPRTAAAPAKRIEPMLQSRSSGASALESGYAALTQGRLPEAKQAYTQALAANPQERDALLGLAYIAHQQGRTEEARSYYQRVLRQEPGNAVARAGLLTLSPTQDARELGAQSRDVAEQNPDSAPAQSVLGHSLVRQGRLADAQLAFQRAHVLAPAVALHAFNLAVALDRLRRYPAARHYYELALALSAQSGGERGSGVPLAEVQERLVQIQAATPTGFPHEQ